MRKKGTGREFVIPPIVYTAAVGILVILGALLTVLIFAYADVLKAFFLPVILAYLVLLAGVLAVLLHRKYQRETMARYGLSREELAQLEREYKEQKRR